MPTVRIYYEDQDNTTSVLRIKGGRFSYLSSSRFLQTMIPALRSYCFRRRILVRYKMDTGATHPVQSGIGRIQDHALWNLAGRKSFSSSLVFSIFGGFRAV